MDTVLKLIAFLDTLAFGVFLVTLLVLLPLSFVRKTYIFAGAGLLIASWVLGLQLLVLSLQICFHYIGSWAIGIAVFTAGTALVPLAVGLTLFKGTWSQVFIIVATVAFIWGIRIRALRVGQKAVA